MGGKSKQSQRTKNNARPSSSSRSAELLNSSAGLEGGLLTLGNGKPHPPLFPTLAAANLEQGLNPEFQMCIKKLNKKDPITRTKALQELCELINNGDVEDVVAALPSWAHFYKILTADTDRKVREMTQVCQGAVVRRCGRRVAPQLKALLPAWLQAQYDEHAPAQAQAHLSLTRTFPDNKLPEVISFCKAEVIAHLLDNLNGNTEALIKKRIENAEERSLQLERIVTSSLRGLQYFALHLPAAHDAWLWAALAPLLHAAFWKLPHSTPHLRSAWLGALGTLAARYGGTLGAAHGTRALRLLLADTRAPAPLWGCLLQFMQHVPDWHTYLDKKELLVKRILELLENGGWGDAKQLSNMLLPLLAYLPPEILTEDFYEAFFNAMFIGLEKKNVLSSKSERQAWITSLAECVRYVSIQTHSFVPARVCAALRACTTAALGPHAAALARPLAARLAALLRYWLARCQPDPADNYDQLVRHFWQNATSTILAQIDESGTDHDEIAKSIDGHIVFLQTLKTSFSQEEKKQQSIKFVGDSQPAPEASRAGPACSAALAARHAHCLARAARAAAAHWLLLAERRRLAGAVLPPLVSLLAAFDSRELYAALGSGLGADSAYALYARVLRGWLADDTMRCRALVDVVFLALQHMTEQEQDAVFDSFQHFPPHVVEWCARAAVSHPHVSRGAARRWLRGAGLAPLPAALAARAARCDSRAAALLLSLLADAPQGGWLVSEEGVAGAVQAACAALEEAGEEREGEEEDGSLAARAALGARLAVALAGSRAPHYSRLLLQLLRLDVRVPRGDRRLAADAWCEVRTSWQDGAAALPPHERPALLHHVAAFLHQQLQLTMDKLDIAKIENIVSPCPHLFNRCDNTGAPDDITEIADFTKLIFDMEDPETQAVETHALRYECVTSQLNCLFDDDNDVIAAVIRDSAKSDVPELREAELMHYVNKLLFRAIYLRSLLLHHAAEHEQPAQHAAEHEQPAQHAAEHEQPAQHAAEHEQPAQHAAEHEQPAQHAAEHEQPAQHAAEHEQPAQHAAEHEQPAQHAAEHEQPAQHAAEHEQPAQHAAEHEQPAQHAAEHEQPAQHAAEHEQPAQHAAEHEQPAQHAAEHEQPAHDSAWCDALLHNEDLLEQFCRVYYDYIVIDSLHEGYTFWRHYDVLVATRCKLQALLAQLASAAPAHLRRALQHRARHSAYLWPRAARWHALHAPHAPHAHAHDAPPATALDGHKLEDIVTGNGFFHTLQANTKWSSDEEAAYDTLYLVMLRSWHVAHGADALLRDVTAARRERDLGVIVDAYYRHNHTMLYDRDISECGWSEVVSNVAVVQFLCSMVTSRGWDAPPHHWDFVTITLCSLLNSLRKSMDNWGSTKVSMLARAVLRLWARVRVFVRGVRAQSERRQPSAHVAALCAEWHDMFAPDTHYNMLALTLHLLESCNESEMTSTRIEVIGALMECLKLSDWFALAAPHRRELSVPRLARAAAAALQHAPHHAAACLAYCMLRALAEPLVLDDVEKLTLWSDNSSESEEEKERPQFCLDLLHDAFERLHDIVDASLSAVVLGEGTCEMVAMSDSYNAALAWLLLGAALHELAERARGDLQQQYASMWRLRRTPERLLGAALRLLPPAVWPGAPPAPPPHAQLFTASPDLSVHEAAVGATVGALACRAVYCAVTGVGAAGARGWWGAAPPRPARLLQRLVRHHVAPHAARQQLLELQRRAHELEDAEVHIAWSAGEVTCAYSVEERRLELRVLLSRDHPLVAPRLVAPHAAGPGANTHWLALYLAYQNGTLLNALKMWTSAVNARVESAPQCYICYCRLHPATGRLPRVPCHQCRNKFHNDCLRKWFATSNKSSCPLCRSPF